MKPARLLSADYTENADRREGEACGWRNKSLIGAIGESGTDSTYYNPGKCRQRRLRFESRRTPGG
jgi:hypothetical protein